jgi:hypothetical protein
MLHAVARTGRSQRAVKRSLWLGALLLAYRADVFKEKGIQPPRIFRDCLAAAEALHPPRRAGTVLPMKPVETLKAMARFALPGFIAQSNDESTLNLSQDLAAMGGQWVTRAT